MQLHRFWVVNAFIAFVLTASFYDIATGGDHWPFSSYPMYSAVENGSTLNVLRVFGVPDDAPSREVAVIDSGALQPLDGARLAAALDWLVASAGRDKTRRDSLLHDALSDVGQRYEALRVAHRHSLPRLQALKLYRLWWHLDPFARNVDSPDRKDLLYELRLTGVGKHDTE